MLLCLINQINPQADTVHLNRHKIKNDFKGAMAIN